MTGKRPAPPLGHLLVERGLISAEERERALELAEATGRPLGEAVLELDLLPPTQLAVLLAVQRSWRPLGWMLVERGLLGNEELADCLGDGQATGRRLGEVVRARGLVPGEVLESLLVEQYQLELELERGFGAGLRDEIERRFRLERAVDPGEPSDRGSPVDQPVQLLPTTRCGSPPGADSDRVAFLRAALEQRERRLESLEAEARCQSEEIERLHDELADRDATILALRRRLGEDDGYGEPATIHRLRPADAR